jgi:glutaredoxin
VILTLYSKPGCHLCDDLRETLEELRTDHAFALEEIDITTDAGLFARYRFDIPVVLRDGREVARGRISDRELLEILKPQP